MLPTADNCDVDFRTAFCSKKDCSLDEYQQLVFKNCLGVGSKVLAPVINAVIPSFFSYDFELIEKVGRAINQLQVQEAISHYYLLCRYKKSFLHNQLHLRISCSKLQKLAFDVFETEKSQ